MSNKGKQRSYTILHERYKAKLLSDDVYEGMLIPKGSMIFVGIWAIHQNDKIYPDCDKFDPDRYLGHPGLAAEYAVGSDYNRRDKFTSPDVSS